MIKIKSFMTYAMLRHMSCLKITSSARLMSNVSNKRITRLLSDTEVAKSELKSDGNESLLDTRLVNRNPRNLEQMLWQQKPLGFEMDLPERHFWNKIVFTVKGKYLTANVVHNSGRVVVSASTDEEAIGQELKSTGGVKAALALGQVLAMRALESGISQVFVGAEYETDKSVKVKTFLDALKDNGLVLEEQPFIFERARRDL